MKDLLQNRAFCEDATRDVLSDHDLAQLCAKTTRAARHRRANNRVKLLSLASVLGLAAYLNLQPEAPKSTSVVGRVPARRVAPRPPLAHTEIQTQPFANVITSEPFSSITETPQTLTYRPISDEELLHLLEGHAIAFVRKPGGRVQLEFLDENQLQ